MTGEKEEVIQKGSSLYDSGSLPLAEVRKEAGPPGAFPSLRAPGTQVASSSRSGRFLLNDPWIIRSLPSPLSPSPHFPASTLPPFYSSTIQVIDYLINTPFELRASNFQL
jgi:hypothetical protein